MPRLLFVPNSHTLVWLDVTQAADKILDDIRRGKWLPPEPFESLAGSPFTAHLQDGIITVTVSGEPPEGSVGLAPRLSRRQKEVLKGLIDGLTTRQISHRLKLKPRTVLFHIAALKALYDADSRAELVHKASLFSGD